MGGEGRQGTYEDINVFTERAVCVCFYDLFEGGAGVEGWWHYDGV